MKDIKDYENLQLENLDDIRDVKVNMDLPKDQRILDYINQIKNPYCYKYKNCKIIICFDKESSLNLESCLSNYFNSI